MEKTYITAEELKNLRKKYHKTTIQPTFQSEDMKVDCYARNGRRMKNLYMKREEFQRV